MQKPNPCRSTGRIGNSPPPTEPRPYSQKLATSPPNFFGPGSWSHKRRAKEQTPVRFRFFVLFSLPPFKGKDTLGPPKKSLTLLFLFLGHKMAEKNPTGGMSLHQPAAVFGEI